ncbi:MAG: winged helix-turn-helix transcriptional regulator [Thaumarchaeota archaeon]|nr:winged helix-turn-helix transcriptional regulator [Nitrososphaerota archaeon]
MEQNEVRLHAEAIDFPAPIVNIIEALSDRQRRNLLINLQKEGDLSWTNLLELTTIRKGTLNHHLSVLEAAGLIRNFSKKDPTTHDRSYYEITPVAQRVIDGIFTAFTPNNEKPKPASDAAFRRHSKKDPNRLPNL